MKACILLLMTLAAVQVRAQVVAPPDVLADLGKAQAALQERLAPAKIDAGVVSKLVDRLSREGAVFPAGAGGEVWRAFSRRKIDERKKSAEVLIIQVLELPTARGRIGGEDSPYFDLVLRRTFSHMVGISQDIGLDGAGKPRIEEYKYTISMGATILGVEHNVLPILGADVAGRLIIDGKNVRSERLDPKDAEVMRRWKSMEAAFLAMGPLSVI